MAQMTHLGGPTVLLELGGWRILTDPTFDPPGRKYQFGWGTSSIKTAGPALTTRTGARRLAAPNVRGLGAGETTSLDAPGKEHLSIRATPCRHGPALSGPVTGPVIGFALTLGHASTVSGGMTGDTVLHRPMRRLARQLNVDVLLMHLVNVRF